MAGIFIAGNWKSNGSLGRLEKNLPAMLTSGVPPVGVDAALFGAFVHLPRMLELLRGSRISVGAQNLSEHGAGAYTGEVCAEMLADLGCRHVLVGHSERRTLFGESDSVVTRKVRNALDAGLEPIVCVGESLEEREGGREIEVVFRQIDTMAASVSDEAWSRIRIAYEPVWAIGTGRVAEPEQIRSIHRAIRERVQLASGDRCVVPLLYGGSVRANNVLDILKIENVDGALVGGASLDPAEFGEICQLASRLA